MEKVLRKVDDYMTKRDWRVKENSNSPYNFGSMNKFIIGTVSKAYWEDRIYDERAMKAHNAGFLHIHDMSGLTIYCCGYSLRKILQMGIQGVSNIPTSGPAKHFDAALNQISNILTIFQNEIMGAVALSSFDTLLAPYVYNDQLTYREVKQSMQNFIYSVNSNSRAGAEPAFTNITFDLFCPPDLRDEPVCIGGNIHMMDAGTENERVATYKEFQREADLINKAFFEIMLQGDYKGQPFAYPIPTYSIMKGFDWDNPNNELLWEMTGKYGYPYFSNYLNSDMEPSDVRAMCPLTGDTLVMVRRHGKVSLELIDSIKEDVEVWSGTKWVKGHPVKVPATPIVHIELSNGTEVNMGVNHLQVLGDGKTTVKASELKVGQWLPFNGRVIETQPVDDLDYELGKAVGAFCGDGNYNTCGDYNLYQITEAYVVDNDEPLYCFEVEDDNHLFMLANGLITHNCRLRLDLTELRRRNGGLFGSGDSTGSIGVVTLNLPRLGLISTNSNDLFNLVREYMEIARDSLEDKRNWLQMHIVGTGMIPAFDTYVGTIDNHFSTIGLVGLNEMVQNCHWGSPEMKADGIMSKDGHQLCCDILDFMRSVLIEFQQNTGHLYNLEATPAESTCYRLAKLDKEAFGREIIQQGSGESVYYTNSCHIPVKMNPGIAETLIHQDDLQTKFTGGTVVHLYANGAVSGNAVKNLIRSAFEKFKLPYLTYSPIIKICPEHGPFDARKDVCPECGATPRVFQRITGYVREIANYNPGKLGEFRDRRQNKNFEIPQATNKIRGM